MSKLLPDWLPVSIYELALQRWRSEAFRARCVRLEPFANVGVSIPCSRPAPAAQAGFGYLFAPFAKA